MSSVNKVILLGNLGRDPEIRSTSDGSKVATFSLATSERWKDRQSGEQRERSEWHRIVSFNDNLTRVIEQYARKGSTVYVEGQLQTRKWQDQSGTDRYSTEVVLTKFRGELQLLGGRGERSQGGQAQSSGHAPPMAGPSDLDDEIGF